MAKIVAFAGVTLFAAIAGLLVDNPAVAQSDPQTQRQGGATNAQQNEDYVPPLAGAPAKRVGGASRGATRPPTPLPIIELLAPADHAGQTISATPTLYYFVSRPVPWPMQLTISAPRQPAPVLEATIPSAAAAGIYPLRLADHRARLEPGVAYTWSVSIIIDPRAWSRNIVASAVIMRTPPTAATERAASASRQDQRAIFARAGLWYDAIAAAFDTRQADRHTALDRLVEQAGLAETARFDRAVAAGSVSQ